MGIIKEDNREQVLGYEEIEEAVRKIKGYFLTAIHCAGSGHSGGSLSAAEIVAAAYLGIMRHKPWDPEWLDRDRFFFSAGHKAPLWYAVLGYCGYFPPEETATLRKFGSRFQGHPDAEKLPGIELSCGSLGQGLSVAVGDALNSRLEGRDYRVYCLMGDGEQQEGQIWEAVMAASHYGLGNLTGIVDKNRLQIDGAVSDVMNIDPLEEKYRAFGWNVITCNGHSVEALLAAYHEAETVTDKPSVIIAETVKGNSISFMENQAGWHGKAPDHEELRLCLAELGLEDFPADKMISLAEEHQKKMTIEIERQVPRFTRDYWWNSGEKMRVEMKPTRMGFGEALRDSEDERICALGSDISGSICINEFYKSRPERKDRWFSMGIAEQSATALSAGFAKNGKIPFVGTYGVFAAGRALDQIRTTLCYGNFNTKIAGAHAGISVGPDGATHQALEEIFQIAGLPNMTMFSSIDANETKKATLASIDTSGPCYLRFAREATPVVTRESDPFSPGLANVIRYLGEETDSFLDAFSVELSTDFKDRGEVATIIATGPVTAEAMRAAWILKEETGAEIRVINMSTIKPLDTEVIVRSALETGLVLTVEEHQKGGLGNLVSSSLLTDRRLYRRELLFDEIGVPDCFGTSGSSWELMKYFGLTAEYIADKLGEMLKEKS